jgi:hypothetical protein
MTSLNLAIASSCLPALLSAAPSENAVFNPSTRAVALAASSFVIPAVFEPGFSSKLISVMSRPTRVGNDCFNASFWAVTRYCPGGIPIWM